MQKIIIICFPIYDFFLLLSEFYLILRVDSKDIFIQNKQKIAIV